MFIGRERELKLLDKKIASDSFEFGLIYGRRRIGKTRMLQEIVAKHHAIYYVANEMGLDYNMRQLSKVIAMYFDEPIKFDNFEDIFKYLIKRSSTQKIVFIVDEFTYLLSTNPELLSVFQNIIDQHLLKTNMTLLLSGSHVGMVEDAITYKKPLYGRTSFKIKLEPFNYYEASLFYPNLKAEDKIRLYSVFGGVPFYTSKIDERKSVKDNIMNLIVEDGAVFEDEVSFFLSQEVRSVATYGKILNAIASGATKLSEITSKSGNDSSGNVSKHLELLLNLGIIKKELCFGENVNTKKTMYRIKDQLFHFHYYFIEKNKSKKAIVDSEVFYQTVISPYLDEYVSLEFENICKEFLIRKYKNTIQDINRFWYNDAKTKTDIEINIVMKNDDLIHVYECKWTNQAIDKRIATKLEEHGQYIKADTIGFFSRGGYSNEIKEMTKETYTTDDLYALSIT